MENHDVQARRVDAISTIDMSQRDGLRRQRARNSRQQVLKIGTVISVLALLIAWLGQDDLPPEQTIAIALPAKSPTEFELAVAGSAKPVSAEVVKAPTQSVPAMATIPVAVNKAVEVQAVPAMAPAVVSPPPPAVLNLATKDVQRINDQAIGLVNEGNPRQAIGLLETALLDNKDSGPLFENLRRLYAGFATQSYQLALEPGKATPVTVELVKTSGETVAVQIASLDMKARNATQALPASTDVLPEMPAKSVLSSESSVASKSDAISAEGLTEKVAQANASASLTAAKSTAETMTETSSASVVPATKEPSTSEKVEANRAVMAVVKRWADAWSRKDADTYIAMYAPNFKPKGMTHEQWSAYRRDRLSKPKSIRVELSDQKAVMLSPSHMRVTFNQMYASDSLKANDKKTLELELIDNQWRITSESGR